MLRKLIVALTLLSAAPASADIVTASTGATAHVSSRYADRFQGLINDLERAGYRIQFMGGYRPGPCAIPRHKHPCGMALDINQTARDVVTRSFPAGTNAMARRHGLFHGAEWQGSPDTGHFEVITDGTTNIRGHRHRAHRNRHHHHRHARAHRHRKH